MKKIWALVLAAAVFATMTGCGKNSSNAEDAAIRDEIMGELSDADKEDIKQFQEELNGDYNEGNSEEQAEEEVFTPEDFPCDPKVLNSKWSDCYYQVADVVVQEYHNVPIMDVISSFENSKLGFKAEDFDPEMEFPYNGTVASIHLKSDYGEVFLDCGINKYDEQGEVLKMKDVFFIKIENATNLRGELSVCQYISKGFNVRGLESDYSIREYEKIIDDDMKEVNWSSLGLDESKAIRMEGGAVYCVDLEGISPNITIEYFAPEDVAAGRSSNNEIKERRIILGPGKNNKLRISDPLGG